MVCTASSASQSSYNLQTLHDDVLHGIMLSCTNLTSLSRLVFTHPAIYQAFNARRRLILRTVFRTETSSGSLDIKKMNTFLVRLAASSPIDGVALREAVWPRFESLLPASAPSRWATALLACYHSANLGDDALLFTRSATAGILAKAVVPTREARTFARAAIKTYLAANLAQEALEFQESFLRRLDPRSSEHSSWAKELVVRYRAIKQPEEVLQLLRINWELYQTILGPNNQITLDWARSIVSEYQSLGDDSEAILFHEQVGDSLDPSTAQYVAWSRQHIQMLQRSGQNDRAILTTEKVWHTLQPHSTGYRAWTAQLSERYEAAGRPDAAVGVCEAAWASINTYLSRLPNEKHWKYHAHGAALMLAKVYRRNNRIEDADALEAISRSLHTSKGGESIHLA